MDIRFLGHASFALADGGTTVLVDPWLEGNPKAVATPDELDADAILLTHGHGDHLGDTVAIAKRTGAPVVAMVELAAEIADEGVDTFGPNFGGTVEFDWGWVRLVPAWHSGMTPKGTAHPPAGLVVRFGGSTVYFLGDTCLFSDLALPARRDVIDVAVVPIGGHFTMDRHDAAIAAELVAAKQIIPCHYDTFPPIAADAQAFKADVEGRTGAEVVVLAPGETHTR